MGTRIAITGGASGLGRVVADRAVARGWAVSLVDRDADALAGAIAELSDSSSAPVTALCADLATMEGVDAVVSGLAAEPGLGALVNNAGGQLPGAQYPDAPERDWMAALALDLLAPMQLMQRLWPVLAASGWDRGSAAVVNIGSSGGEGDAPYSSPEYGAAKAGIRRLSASLGARSDLRVMCVVPGWIGLDRAHAEWSALPPAERARIGPLIPPERIAEAVLDLVERGRAGEIVEILRGEPGDGTIAGLSDTF